MSNYIGGFLVNDKEYWHEFDYETDNVLVKDGDGDGEVLMTFTWNCQILDKDGKQIGKMVTGEYDFWYAEFLDAPKLKHPTVLTAELMFSEWFFTQLEKTE